MPTPTPTGLYDPAIRSDGLTLDSPRGPIDLVSVARAARGFDVPLTDAEHHWITHRQANRARQTAAHALGTGYTALLRDLTRYRTTTTTTRKESA